VQKEYTDQMQSIILLDHVPKRIISLVPSQTEYLYDLGLEEEVIGITKFCIHPASWRKTKTIIGGTKNVSIEKVRALKPDLIIGNKEENSKDDIEQLRSIAPVWMSDIYTFPDALEMMRMIGEMTKKEDRANTIIATIEKQFSELKDHQPSKQESVLYLIWDKPVIGVASNTFIDDVLKRAGFSNILVEQERYPQLNSLKELNPTYVFLSSEPYPFQEKHMQQFQQIFPHSKIKLVDGELFSWYGSRLLKSVSYFNQIV
jgi:ABC-type Fe3+-hydroxamate transport system substrate-binding protein